ncbi:hypothetical protein [Candidatus Galacturonibacter soehngenii]|uniref:Uncharacterized protein n=1 Tax=Candidatus Galacturonatibacter soehngenii TaxID=2307010 RepID=A0A7V7UCX8_9FIRM|nr:hypothetical protein [Candidatus Galacturonibacter soehngenii]KAB1439912.1 hypothetical protein F7O84_05885 [Candidatus Galacturonibacter soehngenii]MBA4685848.1 hypothetical protein [Candidatus Galacturonibacter soehngenii]
MDEIYNMIEELIRASGYPLEVSGFDIYNEICDEVDGKENGSYIFMSKHDNNDIFEYTLTIYDDNFNLGSLSIRTLEGKTYFINFD